MGVAEEELWLGRGAVVEGGDGRHLAGDHSELGRLGLVGHPADLDDGAARVAREGDVGRLALALPPAVVAEEEVEVGGSVVGLPRLVHGGVGEDKGRVPPGAPLGAALLCLVKGLGGRGRAAAGSFRPEPVRIPEQGDPGRLALGLWDEGGQEVLARGGRRRHSRVAGGREAEGGQAGAADLRPEADLVPPEGVPVVDVDLVRDHVEGNFLVVRPLDRGPRLAPDQPEDEAVEVLAVGRAPDLEVGDGLPPPLLGLQRPLPGDDICAAAGVGQELHPLAVGQEGLAGRALGPGGS